MATLRITFTPTSPAPANGYTIAYRKEGTGAAYTTVNTSSSPVDITVDDGWSYEGYIRANCANGATSVSVDFTAAVTAEPCYIYEFSNAGGTNATVYYKECNLAPVQSLTVLTGGTQVYQCCQSSYVIINSTQIPPGSNSGTVDGVTYARTFDPGCV